MHAQEAGMAWLETIGVFLLGWFGKKLKRFAETMLDTMWFLLRCTPSMRCYFFTRLYAEFLAVLCDDLDAGRLRERERQAALLLVSRLVWLDPRLKAWQARVRAVKPAP
jgi:hypothetical protein